MALSKESMAERIADKLIAAGIIQAAKKAEVMVIWTEICDGIIDELKNEGVVSTTVTGTADLITGEVTGTGTGTIS